jgi:t-SNARE complex subunit (syntaxin)
VKTKDVKKAATKIGKQVAKSAAPKIKAMKKAAKPIIKKVKRAVEDFADDAADKGREVLKDTLSASAKKLKKASKAI